MPNVRPRCFRAVGVNIVEVLLVVGGIYSLRGSVAWQDKSLGENVPGLNLDFYILRAVVLNRIKFYGWTQHCDHSSNLTIFCESDGIKNNYKFNQMLQKLFESVSEIDRLREHDRCWAPDVDWCSAAAADVGAVTFGGGSDWMEPCDLSEQMASRSAAEDGCDAHRLFWLRPQTTRRLHLLSLTYKRISFCQTWSNKRQNREKSEPGWLEYKRVI